MIPIEIKRICNINDALDDGTRYDIDSYNEVINSEYFKECIANHSILVGPEGTDYHVDPDKSFGFVAGLTDESVIIMPNPKYEDMIAKAVKEDKVRIAMCGICELPDCTKVVKLEAICSFNLVWKK
jgi:hypothetical protein